jgi:hypothetical protein
MTPQQALLEPVLGSFGELNHARAFALDVVVDNMTLEEAQEIVDSWNNLKIAHFIQDNWNGGCQGWAQRGEWEYR